MVSALGTDGPEAGLTAYDLVAQALSGLLLAGARPGDEIPRRAGGIAMADFTAGLLAAISLLAGLVGRREAAPGIEVSLLGAALAVQAQRFVAVEAVDGAPRPPRAEPATRARPRRAGRARARLRGARALLPRLPRGRRLLRAHVPERGAAPHGAARARARGPVRRRSAGPAGVGGGARRAHAPRATASRRCSPRRPPGTGSRGCAPRACPPPRCARSTGSTTTRRCARTGSCRRSTRPPGRRCGCSAASSRSTASRRARGAASPRWASTPRRSSPGAGGAAVIGFEAAEFAAAVGGAADRALAAPEPWAPGAVQDDASPGARRRRSPRSAGPSWAPTPALAPLAAPAAAELGRRLAPLAALDALLGASPLAGGLVRYGATRAVDAGRRAPRRRARGAGGLRRRARRPPRARAARRTGARATPRSRRGRPPARATWRG